MRAHLAYSLAPLIRLSPPHPTPTPLLFPLSIIRVALWCLDFDMNALRQELETDVHTASIEELCRRFNTTVDMGKTRYVRFPEYS